MATITLTPEQAACIAEAAAVNAGNRIDSCATPGELVECYDEIAQLVELIRETERFRVTRLENLGAVAGRLRDDALEELKYEHGMLKRLRAGHEGARVVDATMEESEWLTRREWIGG